MAVLCLYARPSGAQDLTVVRYMRESRSLPGVIDWFEQLPFELWRGTNVFNDDFDVLYGKVN